MLGRIDAELATVAFRDASQITVPYAAGDSLDAWCVITCGEALVDLIWRRAPMSQAVLRLGREGHYQCRYPSLYGKSREDILNRNRKSNKVCSRIKELARQHDAFEGLT